jgi:pyruvate dehydrogenase E2 component (dihydrolipoamide acetyltransferase)
MPRLSDSMEEGTILKWLKSDGDEVEKGEDLVEIETDKATMTYEADQSGTLEIVAAEGDTLPIGDVIARIGGGSDAKRAETAEHRAAAVGDGDGRESPAPAGERAAGEQPASDGEPRPPAAAQPAPEPARAAPPPAGNGGDRERVKASPVARRMAREMSVDLNGLQGSGPGGRIVKADVEAAGGDGAAATAPEPAAGSQPADGGRAKGDTETQELSRTQQLIARRMAESRATVPHFSLNVDIDMEGAVRLRAELDEAPVDEPVPSLNDFIVKACALALREFPRVNGSYRDGRFQLHGRVNVGVAVAVEDGLVVPTLFDADRKPLGEIAREARAVAERVRSRTITPPELSGGTFTVSNLGMFGIESFEAVINPPQAAILAVGVVEPRAVVEGDRIVARHRMAATLSCDHRILYGADAARFLARVRELLEKPHALLL